MITPNISLQSGYLIRKRCKSLILIILASSLSVKICAQANLKTYKYVPVNKVFYGIGKNAAGSFAYHYGLNYIMAGAITYGMVKSNLDWNWYRYSYSNRWIYNTGYVSVYTGSIVPTALSLGLYIYGRADKNSDIQITGLALGQAALLGVAISSGIKMLTGRVPPTDLVNTDELKGDFRFGFMKGGANNGWPSSHTCVAFSMATALIQLYPDNTAIKICSLTYASLIGLGVSTNIHWASDAVAGALIGWAIGRTVGITFRNLMNDTRESQAYSFGVTPSGVYFNYRF